MHNIGRYALQKQTAIAGYTGTLLSLEDLKLHSRIDGNAEDPILQLFLTAVQDWIEGITSRAMTPTQYLMTFDRFPRWQEPIEFPRSPLISLQSISYLDLFTGTTQNLTVSGSGVQVICNANGREPGRVAPVYETYWPRTLPVIDACQMVFTAGYADDTDPTCAALKVIMLKLASTWYEFREAVSGGLSVAELPGAAAFQAILQPYIVPSFGA